MALVRMLLYYIISASYCILLGYAYWVRRQFIIVNYAGMSVCIYVSKYVCICINYCMKYFTVIS